MAFIGDNELNYTQLLDILIADVQQDERIDEDTKLDIEACVGDLYDALGRYC